MAVGEVRGLTKESADAAKDIRTLIANVRQESAKAVEGTGLNAGQAEAGAKVMQDMKSDI